MKRLALMIIVICAFGAMPSTVFARSCSELGKAECSKHASCYFKDGRKCATRSCNEKTTKEACGSLKGCAWKKVRKHYKCTGTPAFL